MLVRKQYGGLDREWGESAIVAMKCRKVSSCMKCFSPDFHRNCSKRDHYLLIKGAIGTFLLTSQYTIA